MNQQEEVDEIQGELTRAELEAKLKEAQERLARYEGYQKLMEETGASQLSITDADEKLMKNKNGFAVAYNAQIVVDSETHLIRDFQMTNQVTDHGLLESTISEVKEAESENVETIGPKAIIGCKNLKEINVSLQNKFYTEVDGVLFDKNMETLLVYPGANENEEYIVPDGIRRIDKVAFAGCSNLKKIILPETLEDIGIGAFEDCSELKEIEIPYNVKKLPHLLFMRCTSIENIYLPYGLEEIDDWALACDSENLKEIVIPETVDSISDYAFSDDTELLVREDSYAYVWSQAHSRKYRCIE